MADYLCDVFVSVARRMARCHGAWRKFPFTRIGSLRSVLVALLFSAIPGLSLSMSMRSYAEITAVSSAVVIETRQAALPWPPTGGNRSVLFASKSLVFGRFYRFHYSIYEDFPMLCT